MIKPPPNVLELPLEERAEMAFKAAVEKAIIDHARRSIPFYIGETVKFLKCQPTNCANWQPGSRRNSGIGIVVSEISLSGHPSSIVTSAPRAAASVRAAFPLFTEISK
jgi:hypothetical protein